MHFANGALWSLSDDFFQIFIGLTRSPITQIDLYNLNFLMRGFTAVSNKWLHSN